MPPRLPRSTLAITRAVRQLRAGQLDEAVESLREAALLHPDNAEIQHDLGLSCLQSGRLAEAVEAFRQAIALRPAYTDAHFRLGLALERGGDARGALMAYDRATELLPSLAEAWFRAGALAFTLGHRGEAIGCFRRAAATGRKNSFGRLGEARALLAGARDRQAERVLRHLLARDPGAAAYDLLGNLLADDGRFDEARVCFARAVAAEPLMAGSFYDLVRCRRVTAADADLLPGMQAALALPGLQAEQRIRVHLALGKAQDDLGDPGAAMGHFDAADAVRRTLMPFDAVLFDRQVDRLISLFPVERFALAGPSGHSDAVPVFIMGMPRSGTTLTEQVVSSHPQVGAGGELNFWNERGIAWMSAAPGSPGGAPLDADAVARLASDYLALLRGTAPGAARVTDKMPFNFLWAGLIHLVFPRAILLHCRRAAIDTAVSVHQTLFSPRLAFPTGGTELVCYVRAYERLTAHWRRVLPADRFVEFDYEDLTGAPEATIRRIIGACGLSWEEACMRPDLNPHAVRTPSRWQARQPIYRDAVAKWRRYEPWLGPLRALLNEDGGANAATMDR